MDIRLLTPADAALLDNVADGVFDEDVDGRLTAEFLADPRHHLCVAVDDGAVVAFASAVHYVHPDKRAQLWINEVATALGRELGCTEAWVLTDEDNAAARALYGSAGGVESTGVVMVTFQFED
jgi:aminoglycoside 6'-N-acetyltransferase I